MRDTQGSPPLFAPHPPGPSVGRDLGGPGLTGAEEGQRFAVQYTEESVWPAQSPTSPFQKTPSVRTLPFRFSASARRFGTSRARGQAENSPAALKPPGPQVTRANLGVSEGNAADLWAILGRVQETKGPERSISEAGEAPESDGSVRPLPGGDVQLGSGHGNSPSPPSGD